jgi:hypothetical protein
LLQHWDRNTLERWSDGVLEYWSNGFKAQHSTTPSLRYSNYFPLSAVGENTDKDFPSLKKHALSLVEGSGQERFGQV